MRIPKVLLKATHKKYMSFVGLIAIVGTFTIIYSFAASPYAVINPSNWALSGGATNTSFSGASGGKIIKFNAPSTPVPSPAPAPAPSPVPGSRSLNCAPAASMTMTNTTSHLCGFPDITNTGLPSGLTLKRVPQDITSADSSTGSGWHYDSRGWISVDTNGAVIKNIDTSLNIDVVADNVTVKNVRVRTAGGDFGVSLRHTANAIIEDSEISGSDAGSNRLMVAVKDIYGDTLNTKALRNNIYYVSTGVQLDAGLIQDNYIHDMGFQAGDHINGTTSNGGGTAQLVIRHNTSFNQYNQTDAISLFEDFGAQTNRIIDNNLVAGGGYCIYGGQNSGGAAASNIQITNNHFSRLFYPNCGYYGPVAAWPLNGPGGIATGNIWDDSGAPVNF